MVSSSYYCYETRKERKKESKRNQRNICFCIVVTVSPSFRLICLPQKREREREREREKEFHMGDAFKSHCCGCRWYLVRKQYCCCFKLGGKSLTSFISVSFHPHPSFRQICTIILLCKYTFILREYPF